MRESIFLATLGAEPQVVSLALDALLAQNVPITRVEVIHTVPQYEPIRSSLQRLQHEFVANNYYGERLIFVPHLLAGETGPLTDVTTPAEMDTAFQVIYTLLRQHKYAGRSIHFCIAGGRKTMALFAMAAAQILFDSSDRVWHVVSTPKLIETKALHSDVPESVQLISIPIAYPMRDDISRVQAFLRYHLTDAEREIVHLLLQEGLSNAALAARLKKSPKTVANQLSRVYAKLQAYFNLNETPDRTMLLVHLGRYSQNS